MYKYETVFDLKNCNEDIILFGTGKVGKDAIKLFQKNNINIANLCDNNIKKQGTTISEINIISLEKAIEKFKNPVFIITMNEKEEQVVEQFERLNITNFYLITAVFNNDIQSINLINKNDILVNREKMLKDKEIIKDLKDKHKNERCFIIGNGPSLKPEDLDKIKNEYSFTSNFIFDIYDKTSFRPTYYTKADLYLLNSLTNEQKNKTKESFKVVFTKETSLKKFDLDSHVVNIIYKNNYPNLPEISCDALNGVYHVPTITYMNIQLAIYMGFKELIFLGLDHNYSRVRTSSKKIMETDCKQDHFYSHSKFDIYKANIGFAMLEEATLGYQKAREYGKENDIKMLNATRGGKLEVFERIDFDTLF